MTTKKLALMTADFLEVLFIGVGVFLIVYLLVAQFLEISGDSMVPTLKDKESLVAEKISYKLDAPKRGDIVILKHPQNQAKLLIKRIVGLPMEKIRITNGFVYINDVLLDETTYLKADVITTGKSVIQDNIEYQIEPNGYVVFGDNRQASSDSREWGALPRELISGKALFVFYPLKSMRLINTD